MSRASLLELLKEVRQRQLASQLSRVISAKPSAFDLHAHWFAASHNSPAPRRRIGGLAGRPYIIAPVVQFLNHSQVAEFPVSNAFNVSLPERGFGITLSVMFKSDRSSMIMLVVNAGIPLASLVAVVALIFRQMIFAAS
jgi:hypothetical protein